ncbi:MAG: hypothetical protein R3D02_12140 [Hyphomicrobiales bacterium]
MTGLGIDRPGAGARMQPVEPPVLVDDRPERRLFQRHFLDPDLTLQQRRQGDVDVEPPDRHFRRRLRADDDVGEGQRRAWQERRLGLAAHPHLLAEHARRLGFEDRPVGRPVDEIRPDQRRNEGDDDGAANAEIELVQDTLPAARAGTGASPTHRLRRPEPCPGS